MKINIKDHLITGLLIGLLLPSLGILGFYLYNFGDTELHSFLDVSVKEKLLSPLLSLCCVINLAVFYLFVQNDHFLTSKGIILSTFVYGFIIVLLKFFL